MKKSFYFSNGQWKSGIRAYVEGDTTPPADFTPEQQKVIDGIIGKRLESEKKKYSEAAKSVEELSAKAKRTEEENTKLQASLQELREANMTAEERNKEQWKREIGNREKQIAELKTQADTYKAQFESTIVDNALRKYVQEANFHPKAVDHFIAVSKGKAVVAKTDSGFEVRINTVSNVNGVPTPTIQSVDKYVQEQAQSEEWQYAIASQRKGGLGYTPSGNQSGGVVSEGSPNDRVNAGLKKEGLIK